MRRWLPTLLVPLTLLASDVRAGVPTCAELAAARRVDEGDPALLWSRPIATAVTAAEARFGLGDARGPRVAWLELGAATGAWYCRASDTVYLSAALARYAHLGRASDGADFLAFVIGHELAHRRFDAIGAESAASPLDGRSAVTDSTLRREALTDERAAFLVALSRNPYDQRNFSPWRLARAASLQHYLADEVGLGASSDEARLRAEALLAALERMEGLADVYELALALAFSPLPKDGPGRPLATGVDVLLDELDVALNPPASWARVPELSLTRAVLHAGRAAAARATRCTLRVAGHAALSPFDAVGARGAHGIDVDGELAAARTALADARARQLPEAQIARVEACLDRVAAADAPSPEGPPTASPPLVRGDDVAIERMALVAEGLCGAPHERVVPLADGHEIHVRGRHGAHCYTVDDHASFSVATVAPSDHEAADLTTWLGACDLVGRGVADDGGDVYGVLCPSVDGWRARGWTLFARDASVRRVVRIMAD